MEPMDFYRDEERISLGNDENQLHRGAYPNRLANPSHAQPSAPLPPHSHGDGNLESFPTLESGSPSSLRPPAFQVTNPYGLSGEFDWWPYSDDLDNLGSATNDSGYQSSTQPTNTLPTTNDSGGIHHLQQPYDFSTPYQPPFMLPNDPPARNSPTHQAQPSQLSQPSNTLHQAAPVARTGKRSSPLSGFSEVDESAQRTVKAARVGQTPLHRTGTISPHSHSPVRATHDLNSAPKRSIQSSPSRPSNLGTFKLDSKQKNFIRKWFKDFAKGQENPYLAIEEVNALGTLLKAPPQPVLEYINEKFINVPAGQAQDSFKLPVTLGSSGHKPSSGYSIAEANKHLPLATLRLVEKYVQSSQRRRAQNDGRRSVNEGPFKCTFGCGYQTKRAFDWRRHEETHDPQELWLCHFCIQNGDPNPFLVNRRDKFLKHAKDAHRGRDVEGVVEMSKVDFRARFDPQCPLCPEVSKTWDDRCRHILNHYEDDIHRKSLGESRSASRKGQENASDEDDSESPEEAESSDSSDDEDDDQDHFDRSSHRRDPTGGAGGGSGNMGGHFAYKSNMSGEGSAGSDAQDSYEAFSNMGYFNFANRSARDSSLQKDFTAIAGNEVVLRSTTRSRRPCFESEELGIIPGPINPSDPGNALSHSNSSMHSTGSLQAPHLTLLGHGSHGRVDMVQSCITGAVFARKVSGHAAFPQEVEILKRLSHPHIVQFVTAYLQNSALNLIMTPIAQLTLRDWLGSMDLHLYNLERVHGWVGCLSSALAYIHSKRIRHADIKPHNVLIRGDEVFFTDFGISRLVSEPDSTSSSISPSTPLYAPVEIAEHRAHGRKADIFSLGCVVLEMLTHAQGKSIKDLQSHLGFPKRKRRMPRDTLAYYKFRGKLLSWISIMRRQATTTTRRLWDICEIMLENKIDLRPSASLLLEEVRKTLRDGEIASCKACTFREVQPGDADPNDNLSSPNNCVSPTLPKVTSRSKQLACLDQTSGKQLLSSSSHTSSEKVSLVINPALALLPSSPSISNFSALACACACTVKKKRSSALLGLFDILTDYEMSPQEPFGELPTVVEYSAACQAPPAYELAYTDSPLYPMTISAAGTTPSSQLHDIGHAAQVVEIMDIGKVGSQFVQKTAHAACPSPPRSLAQASCHHCGSRFVAPRLDLCRKCSHIRCESCTVVHEVPNSRWSRKADTELTAIGSHLSPPAYSLHDSCVDNPAGNPSSEPLADLETERTVLDLVISQSTSLGEIPGERFIEEAPSTFDRLSRSPNRIFPSPRSSFSSAIDSHLQPSSYEAITTTTTSTPSTSTSISNPQTKSVKLSNYNHVRLSRRQGRRFISGRSKQTVQTKAPQAMNNQQYATPLYSRESTSRLHHIQKSHSTSNDGDVVSRLPKMSRSRTTSFDSSEAVSRMPAFRKSQTSSTTASDEVAGLEVVRTVSLTAMHRESVEVAQGEFSKPRIRRWRASDESTKSQKEFQYYGRHANSWLFNDISISGSIKKRWGKVFSKSDGEE